jgi:hypothetical protein
VKRAALEAATMLQMPPLIFALHFEAELGEYFELTTLW